MKKIEQAEIIEQKPEFIKNINDYSQFTILLDEIEDTKRGFSLLEILLHGKNPHIDILKKSLTDKENRETLQQEYSEKFALYVNKVLRKNLVLVISIVKQYTDIDLEENPFYALEIMDNMIAEYMMFKKKS